MRISDWSSDVCSSDLQVALRHRQVAAAVGERLEDDVDVGLAGADAEDRAPAHAVQRLEHRVAVLATEGIERGGIAADPGVRAALGDLERGDVLVEVVQAARAVHDLPALARRAPPHKGAVDEFGIDQRNRPPTTPGPRRW